MCVCVCEYVCVCVCVYIYIYSALFLITKTNQVFILQFIHLKLITVDKKAIYTDRLK